MMNHGNSSVASFPSIKHWSRFIQSTKTVLIISIERAVKISSTASYNPSFPIIFSAVKLGFQTTEKKKSDGAMSGLYGGCGVSLNRETSDFSWVVLAV
jgi:hypothetical protein